MVLDGFILSGGIISNRQKVRMFEICESVGENVG